MQLHSPLIIIQELACMHITYWVYSNWSDLNILYTKQQCGWSPATPGPCIINISSVQSKDEKRLVTVSKNKTTPTQVQWPPLQASGYQYGRVWCHIEVTGTVTKLWNEKMWIRHFVVYVVLVWWVNRATGGVIILPQIGQHWREVCLQTHWDRSWRKVMCEIWSWRNPLNQHNSRLQTGLK